MFHANFHFGGIVEEITAATYSQFNFKIILIGGENEKQFLVNE